MDVAALSSSTSRYILTINFLHTGSNCYYDWEPNGHFRSTICVGSDAKRVDPMLYTGRILTGVGVGISSLVVPVSIDRLPFFLLYVNVLPLSRLSLYLDLLFRSLYAHSRLFSFLYLELSPCRSFFLVPCEVEIEIVSTVFYLSP